MVVGPISYASKELIQSALTLTKAYHLYTSDATGAHHLYISAKAGLRNRPVGYTQNTPNSPRRHSSSALLKRTASSKSYHHHSH